MEMCPSSGLHLDKLGERADPLPPKRKRRYEQQKARTKAVKAGAIQSRKHQVEGRRKTVKKRKVSFTLVGLGIPSANLNIMIALAGAKHDAAP